MPYGDGLGDRASSQCGNDKYLLWPVAAGGLEMPVTCLVTVAARSIASLRALQSNLDPQAQEACMATEASSRSATPLAEVATVHMKDSVTSMFSRTTSRLAACKLSLDGMSVFKLFVWALASAGPAARQLSSQPFTFDVAATGTAAFVSLAHADSGRKLDDDDDDQQEGCYLVRLGLWHLSVCLGS